MNSHEKHFPHPGRGIMIGLAILSTICFAALPSFAESVLPASSVLPGYAIVSVGSGATLNANSGPIVGSVLVGNGSTTSSAGGGNGAITGVLDVSPPVSGNLLASLNTPPTVNMVDPTVGQTAFSDAAALSAAASALTPTVGPLGNISGAQTFTATGPLNVINIGNWSSPQVTLVGGPNDYFIFNLTTMGTINTPMNIGGVDPAHILWNLTGTNTTVLQTAGCGNLPAGRFCEYGTFLATGTAARFQFSALNLQGQLINTGGYTQFVSNSSMTSLVFNPVGIVPEPGPLAPLAAMAFGVVGLSGVLRRKQRRAN